MKNLKLLNLNNISFVLIIILFIFGRVFMGLNIFSLRFGEILMGFSALIFLTLFIKDIVNFKELNQFQKNCTLIFLFIILHFVYLLISNPLNSISLYIFKTSSYIWVLGFYYLGKSRTFNYTSRNSLATFFIVLILSYFSSIFGIQNSYQDFLLQFTDKFDYLKASDLIIFFIFFVYFFKSSDYKDNSKLQKLILLFAFFYLPLMMNKSRGASIAFIIFILFLIYDYFQNKESLKNSFFFLTLVIIIFITSAFIVSKSPIEIEEVDEKIKYISTSRYEKPVQNTPNVYEDYPIIYIENYRIFSSDGNLNWRLQIWQDVFVDLKSQKLIMTGYGYNYKIPAMTLDFRAGNDGTNENVHNFFVNIFARGGLIHLILYLAFFITLYRQASLNENKKTYLMIFVPLIFTSFFDASMENAHYPLLFYFLNGKIVNLDN